MHKALEAAFRSTASTSALDIESILAGTVSALSFCSAAGRRNANGTMYTEPRTYGPITNNEKKRRSEMPLTRDFKETIQERASRDARFREALLKEAVDALLSGEHGNRQDRSPELH
jgi:hypothetical protein